MPSAKGASLTLAAIFSGVVTAGLYCTLALPALKSMATDFTPWVFIRDCWTAVAQPPHVMPWTLSTVLPRLAGEEAAVFPGRLRAAVGTAARWEPAEVGETATRDADR
jgi:hypothetical protein